jgi:hypothetical protein
LQSSYPWFPQKFTFEDGSGDTVTWLLGPTFGTADGQPYNSATNKLTYWLDDNEGPDSPGLATDQTNYPAGYVPKSNFLGFNKYFSSPSSYWAGTAMKFSSPIHSLSFNLSRPGQNAGNSSNIEIYLFNTTAAGVAALVAQELVTAYNGGAVGAPEWITYDSPAASPFDLVIMCSSDRFILDNLATPEVSSTQTKLGTPILLSPADSPHINTFANVPRDTTVAWKPVLNAGGYQVDLELEGTSGWPSSPTSAIVSEPTATSYEFTALSADGSYRWRVTALPAAGDTAHLDSTPSGWLYFNYNSIVTLSTPTLISPSSNAAFYNNPRLTTLAWGAVPGATGYTVEVEYKDPATGKWVADDTDFTAGALPAGYVEVTGEQNSTETYTAAVITPASGKTPAEPVSYQWRVTAEGDGVTTANSNPSTWYQFTYHN